MANALPLTGGGPLVKKPVVKKPVVITTLPDANIWNKPTFTTGAAATTPEDRAAAAIAAGIIDPQTAAINRQVQAAQAQKLATAEAAKGIAAAYGKLTAGIPGAVQGAYSQAAGQTAGFASGITGQIGAAAQDSAQAAAAQIAAMHAPGQITSVAPQAMDVANYVGGYIPASNLAAEAASRMSMESGLIGAGGVSLSQQALQLLGANDKEITDLQNKGLDIENTRPAEIAKALAALRQEKRDQEQIDIQSRAEKLNEKALTRQWAQTLDTIANNRTDQTGYLHVVRNGKVVRTNQIAQGSAAGRALLSAQTSQANSVRTATAAANRLTEQQAHNRALEGIAQSGIDISQQNANTAAKREAAYQKNLQNKNRKNKLNGGLTDAAVAKYANQAGTIAYQYYNGVKDPKTDKFTFNPQTAADAMGFMVSKGIPYSLAWKAIYQYAAKKGGANDWSDALAWNPGYKPPASRNKKPDKRPH